MLNPNYKIVKNIFTAIAANNYYCPCMPEKTEDTKCICKRMRETGECHCNLFVKEGDDSA